MASESITIVVTGHPVAKGRGRAFTRPGGGIGMFTPKKTRRWEQDARDLARCDMYGRELYAGCLKIRISVDLAVPQSWPEWKRDAALDGRIAPSGRPDLDNVIKAAKDAFNGVVWVDDSQIVEVGAIKEYSAQPAVTIDVTPLNALSARISKKSNLETELRIYR